MEAFRSAPLSVVAGCLMARWLTKFQASHLYSRQEDGDRGEAS